MHGSEQGRKHFMIIGSILQLAAPEAIVWGCGYIAPNVEIPHGKPDIRAVRGPHTREKLLKQGHKCPPVYGDPALLVPRYFKGERSEQYNLGIIPHYVDKNSKWVAQFKDREDINIIDIQALPVQTVIDEALKCNNIISSSLHGVILGDSYGIPSYHVVLSNKVFGGGFKFKDYYASVGREYDPYIIEEDTTFKDIFTTVKEYEIDLEPVLDKLMKACPLPRK